MIPRRSASRLPLRRLLPMSLAALCLLWVSLVEDANAGRLAGCGDPVRIPWSREEARSRIERPTDSAAHLSAAGGLSAMLDGGAGASLVGANAIESDPAQKVPPGVAFLMSALVPGTGQLVEGRRRAFVYLTVEALAWISHFSFEDAGNKKEGEYEAYARAHWDFDEWQRLSYNDVAGCEDAFPEGSDREDAEETLLAFLEEGNYQHYYEDIGKLEAYRAGWDDFNCGNGEEMSTNRKSYRGMRADSNDYLEKARFAQTVAFLNRVVSAVDAYRTARGARLPLTSTTSLELGVAGSLRSPRARIQLRRIW